MRYADRMHGTLPQPRRWLSQRTECLLLLSGLFWLFTYVLLSVRAGVIPEAVPLLFSPRRLIAVTAGAAIYYAAARYLIQIAAKPRLTTILGTFVISVAAALTIRLGLDQVIFIDAASASYSVRWALVWTGYFGVWLIGTLAYFDSIAVRDAEAKPLAAIVPPPATEPISQADALALEWLVDILAVELAERGSLDRRAMAMLLISQAGYEQADCIDGSADVQNARARLARAIASRI